MLSTCVICGAAADKRTEWILETIVLIECKNCGRYSCLEEDFKALKHYFDNTISPLIREDWQDKLSQLDLEEEDYYEIITFDPETIDELLSIQNTYRKLFSIQKIKRWAYTSLRKETVAWLIVIIFINFLSHGKYWWAYVLFYMLFYLYLTYSLFHFRTKYTEN